ncbi:MAG: 23S rRNA (adenine(2503)-C(2))-methyltransferase RlmN [Deltaproteobacteria bacterium]|jgi:23S rRNA (adenine2503-C2)-methyltransferase|nr:23S rRNA (adenine(2503)-C(2))-methyltransferase RlmN [Deltaproteobacteria bacterium]
MLNLLNLSRVELEDFITRDLGEPSFRAVQVWRWLWAAGARSFAEMSNVSKALRAALAERAFIYRPETLEEQRSRDGTVKLLLRLADGELIETVLIPDERPGSDRRVTQCLSSQAGCSMGCLFCATGALGFVRNLDHAEILGQVLVGREVLARDYGRGSAPRNLVFMGMGEPLLNLDNLLRSLETAHSEQGLHFSRRRITVSTCGLPHGLRPLGESGLAGLALSLHAPEQELRARIMPKAARWPMDELLAELERYPLGAREHITLEYLLLGGVNDAPEQARALGRLARRLEAKINLIAYNMTEGAPYAAPSPERVLAFERELWSLGLVAVLRRSMGADIQAACGQLRASASNKAGDG